ncbi:MAG TPA: SDR family NAD(P)-dependent oxidoreductase, partial [Chitinophagaceae bacterium]|nr:SDR family NAD(P)-dependent oxidoreductase [Chitinophagaceae bacterium]
MDSNNKRVALVTGATGGLGTAMCRELLKDGYRVVANYRNPKKAEEWLAGIRAEGLNVDMAEGDVCDFDSMAHMIADIESRIGGIDIVVNNAGITRDGRFSKMSREDWLAVIDTNLNSAFNVTRNVIEGMIDRKFGRIINISSVNGQRGQFGQANYSAAKAGLHGFTKTLAMEVAKYGITVNTISPGYIAT